MIDPEQQGCEAVDRLVKDHLDRKAQNIDAMALLARVRALRQRPAKTGASPANHSTKRPQRPRLASLADRLFGPSPSPAPRRWPWLTWPALAALAILLAFAGGRYLGPMSAANAAMILRGLQAAHWQTIDRCYRVQYAPDPRYWDGKNKLEGPSHSVLWTRGDRFWSDCTIAEIKLSIGREEDGTLWICSSRDKGIRFTDDPSQWPQEVALICAVNSMTVPALVDDALPISISWMF